MRKLVCVGLLLCFSAYLFAEKGKIGLQLGGGYGFSFTKTALKGNELENNKDVAFIGANGIGFDGEINYGITDSMTIGLGVGYLNRSKKYDTLDNDIYADYIPSTVGDVTTWTKDGLAGYYNDFTGNVEAKTSYIPITLNIRNSFDVGGKIKPYLGIGFGYFSPSDTELTFSQSGSETEKNADGSIDSIWEQNGSANVTVKNNGTLGYTGEVGLTYPLTDTVSLFAGARATLVSFRPKSEKRTNSVTTIGKDPDGTINGKYVDNGTEEITYTDSKISGSNQTVYWKTTTTTVGSVTTTVTETRYENGDTLNDTFVTDTSGAYPVYTSTSVKNRKAYSEGDNPLDSVEGRIGISFAF